MAILLWAAAAGAEDVAIVRSSKLALYQEAARGARDALAGVSVLDIEVADGGDARALRRQIDGAQVKVILAVGRTATLLALEAGGPPVVCCMILDAGEFAARSERIAGVHLLVPVADQIDALRALLPDTRKVGMLYDPVRSSDLVDQARAACAQAGIELVPGAASSLKDVLPRLRELKAKGADALLMVADSGIYNRDSIDGILRYTIEAKMAFMASDRELVKGGALCALSASFVSVGAQAAGIVQSVLGGAAIADLPIEAPREHSLAVNLKTAGLVGRTVDPAAVAGAKDVYR